MVKFESQYGLNYQKGPKISEKAQNYGKRPKLCKGPKVIGPGPKENKKGPKISGLGPKGPKMATVIGYHSNCNFIANRINNITSRFNSTPCGKFKIKSADGKF